MTIETTIEVVRAVITYNSVKDNEKVFLSMTSLRVIEFDVLCKHFEITLNDRLRKDGEDNNAGGEKGGRPSRLNLVQDKLFFILFYLKAYPLQEIFGFLFGLSQPQANYWIHLLSDVLKDTLEAMDFMPERTSPELLDKLQSEGKQDFSIDGTERRINRPQDKDEQKEYYSGKKKTHTVKNLIIVGNSDRDIKYLSETTEGKKHDKKIADESQIILPEGSTIIQDTGFQGLELDGVNTIQPKKKPKGKELTSKEKEDNRLISSIRVVVEHVISGIKRLHIVKDIFRNTKEDYGDLVMFLACGLHNFRNSNRHRSY
ncbi:conserved hypothetical protein [Gammaproteobacteria bacterium]